jgi:hypothetical protein
MGYDIGHFDNDFSETLVEMTCFQVSNLLTICPYFHFSNLKQMVRNLLKLVTIKLYILAINFQRYKEHTKWSSGSKFMVKILYVFSIHKKKCVLHVSPSSKFGSRMSQQVISWLVACHNKFEVHLLHITTSSKSTCHMSQ